MKDRINFIYPLRLFAALAVVFIHICMTVPNNSSFSAIGPINYAIYNFGYSICKWAVPVFLMITGYLLLDVNKKISFTKSMTYFLRIAIVLFVFGIVYAVLEIIHQNGFKNAFNEWYLLFPRSFLMVVEGNSWDHLWYLYVLLGIYLFLPLFKSLFSMCSQKYILFLIGILYLVNVIIPLINSLAGIGINTLGIGLSKYVMYFFIGGYLKKDDNLFDNKHLLFIILGFASLLIVTSLETSLLLTNNFDAYTFITKNDALTPFVAIAVFLTFQKAFIKEPFALTIVLSDCSFGVYLLHPLFINVLYKVLKIVPTFTNIILGIFLLFFAVSLISLLAAYILKKIPFVKKNL